MRTVDMKSKTNTRGNNRSTLKSNPREPERVYLSDIKEGMILMKKLLDENKRLKDERQ